MIDRLSSAGFALVPVLNMAGGDKGVLAWRRNSSQLVVITAWSDDYALAARLPPVRDWSRPFAPTVDDRLSVASFADVVDEVLRPRHSLPDEPVGWSTVAGESR